mmetsp:Transcript_65607/g.132018  ORF Transcript_65607/g.132018 Transcript_65607/m.132018 type:complete len:211 (-) Transcript_65607:1603-2235(-)
MRHRGALVEQRCERPVVAAADAAAHAAAFLAPRRCRRCPQLWFQRFELVHAPNGSFPQAAHAPGLPGLKGARRWRQRRGSQRRRQQRRRQRREGSASVAASDSIGIVSAAITTATATVNPAPATATTATTTTTNRRGYPLRSRAEPPLEGRGRELQRVGPVAHEIGPRLRREPRAKQGRLAVRLGACAVQDVSQHAERGGCNRCNRRRRR